MTIEQWLTALLSLTVILNRAIEVVKPRLKTYVPNAELRKVVYLLGAGIGGGVIVYFSDVEPVAFFTDVPVLFYITSGAIMALGSEVIEFLLDGVQAVRDWLRTKGQPA